MNIGPLLKKKIKFQSKPSYDKSGIVWKVVKPLVTRFNPPVEGLKPEEKVVWAKQRGISFWVLFSSMMLGIGSTVLLINLFIFAPSLALPVVILIAIGFIFIFRAFQRGQGIKYYLTNERLIEAKKDSIIKDISLERFQGKPLSQFIDRKVIGTVNRQPIYVFKIRDSQSRATLMEFKNIDQDSVERLETIAQIVECHYCGFKNPANSLQCKNCGAPL